MALAEEDIVIIQELITKILSERPELSQANVRYELELRERIVRVEEELKHQRELMLEGFKQMEKRFEQIEKRFEQIEKRFEQIEKRFEQIDKRFEQIDKRFEQFDKRFEALATRIDRFMIWSFSTTLTVGGLVVAAIKLL